ncbi:alginate lyase family protein [candidate division KSB1 bacterium]|nr:alginate lyase family protein [candidate division KSB1 bacterium]
MRQHLVILVPVLLIFLIGCGEPQKEPVITLYSDIYRIGDQWFCPLCNEPVENGDRSAIDPALYLSEWHDFYLDADYFDNKINRISDAELVASLRLPEAASTMIGNLAPEEAAPWLKRHFVRRSDNRRLYHYDERQTIPFVSIEEFLQEIERDSARRTDIMTSARTVADPDRGYRIGGRQFGTEVDFNADWETWSEFGIHYLRFFTDLLNGYLVTDDAFYGQAFEDLFNQWYEQWDQAEQKAKGKAVKRRNIIWYELGIGNRLPRLIDSYRVHRSRLSPETHARMLKTFLGSGRWLYECLRQTPFHPYNWQTQTAMTLGYLAIMFPEFSESDAWLQASRRNMALHFEIDVYPDGGYVERTGSYTHYVFGMFYRYMRLFHLFHNDTYFFRLGMPRLEQLMEFTALNLAPTGVNCPFNDSRRGTDLAELLADMGVFFNRPDFIGAAAPALDSARLAALPLQPKEPEKRSILFPDSKFAVMREGWNRDAYFLLINFGPFANHGHYDILDFEAFANGVPIALDAGIGLDGYADPIHVSWYKRSPAHNMVTIDGVSCAKRGISGEDVIWHAGEDLDYFAASHTGYRPYQSALCRRHFVFVQGEYWLILDQVMTAIKRKTLDWNLHSPLHMEKTANGFISRERPGAAVLLPEADSRAVKNLLKSGAADLRAIEAVGNREIDWLIFRRSSQADPQQDRFAVLIYPLGMSAINAESIPNFEQVPHEDPAIFIYQIASEEVTDLLIFADGAFHQFVAGITGDFRFGWFRVSKDQDRPLALTVIDASQLNWSDIFEQTWPQRSNFEMKFNYTGVPFGDTPKPN